MKVAPGQVWEDMDRRARGRRLKVERLFMGTDNIQYAACRVGGSGKLTNIRASRFVPGSTGYRLIIQPGQQQERIPSGTEEHLKRAQDQLAEALRAVRGGHPASCLVFVTEAISELSGVQQTLHRRVS